MATPMEFQFLDVGQGDGSFIVMGTKPNQELALVDFGVQRFNKFKVGIDDALTYLTRTIAEISNERKLPAPYLDHLFLTHPDSDHYNYVGKLLNSDFGTYVPKYSGKSLGVGRVTYGGKESAYSKDLIGNLNATTVDDLGDQEHSTVATNGTVSAAYTFVGGKIKVYLLSSNYPRKSASDPNPLSLCLMFADDANPPNKMIFMGDAEEPVEKNIIKTFSKATPGFLNAYCLKLGHHGSQAGTSAEWIQAVKPKAITVTGDFVWAHPYCNTIQRVIDGKTLTTADARRYCCGVSGKEYFNHLTNTQIYVNLWYVVIKAGGEDLMDIESGSKMVGAQGLTCGVQWEMDFDGTATPTFHHTDTYEPE